MFLFLSRDSLTGDGGALWIAGLNTTASLRFSTFTSNAAQSGGAVFLNAPGLIHHCVFSNNTAARGGAIYIYSRKENVIVVKNCSFHNNVVLGGTAHGGALVIKDASLKLSNSSLLDNIAPFGSALCQSGTSTLVSVMQCTFAQNRLNYERTLMIGSTISIENSSMFIMWNSIIHKNDGNGLILGNTRAEISSSTFNGNTNGAITTVGYSSSMLITNSSFISSRRSFISVLQLENTKSIIQKCTFVENKAPMESHILQVSVQKTVDLRLYGCIFIEPNFLSYNEHTSIIYLEARGNEIAKVATMYVLDTSIQYGHNKTLSLERKMFPETMTKLIAVDNVNWTKKSSLFASGMYRPNEANKMSKSKRFIWQVVADRVCHAWK